MRITIVMSARQTGRAATISDPRIVQALQNRACPHGTSAKPARDATRQSSEADAAAAAVANSDAADVVAAGA